MVTYNKKWKRNIGQYWFKNYESLHRHCWGSVRACQWSCKKMTSCCWPSRNWCGALLVVHVTTITERTGTVHTAAWNVATDLDVSHHTWSQTVIWLRAMTYLVTDWWQKELQWQDWRRKTKKKKKISHRPRRSICVGTHPLWGTLSQRGLNPIKLAYNPSRPDGQLR